MDRRIRIALKAKLAELDELELEAERLQDAALASAMEIENEIRDLIDQLQPRIEVTKPQEYFLPGKPIEQDNAAPSERVLAVLTNSRPGPFAIAEFTGLSRKQVGPCLGALVKKGLVRNAGNGTWTAA